MANQDLTRRELLARGLGLGALVAGPLGSPLLGCAGPIRETANASYLALPLAKEVHRVVLAGTRDRDVRGFVERVVRQVTDLAWLSRGDSVLLKVASNSPNPHPAVTSPQAVTALVRLLKDRGAGRVYVADQAGVEHVRLTATSRKSSTREAMRRNGLLAAATRAGAEVHGFDDQGWSGYFPARPDFEDHWDGKLHLAELLRRVDHVINVPRLGTHAVAGYTCGVKNAVGWLRDDSRGALHSSGDTFFERIAEVSHVPELRTRLRFTLTLGERALLNIGPDIGGRYDFGGVLALAAVDLVDHDYLAQAILPWLDRHQTSVFDLYSPYPHHANHWNRRFVRRIWGPSLRYDVLRPPRLTGELAHDVALSHLATLKGYRPQRIAVVTEGAHFPRGLLSYLRQAPGRLLALA